MEKIIVYVVMGIVIGSIIGIGLAIFAIWKICHETVETKEQGTDVSISVTIEKKGTNWVWSVREYDEYERAWHKLGSGFAGAYKYALQDVREQLKGCESYD